MHLDARGGAVNLLSAVDQGRGVVGIDSGVDGGNNGNGDAGGVHSVGVHQLAGFLQGFQVLSSCLNKFSSMALKPINIPWIRTVSQSY